MIGGRRLKLIGAAAADADVAAVVCTVHMVPAGPPSMLNGQCSTLIGAAASLSRALAWR